MNALIDGYLDETLTPEEQATLAGWIKERPENARRFAEAVMLHDRLRSEVWAARDEDRPQRPAGTWGRRMRSVVATVGAAAAAVVVAAVLWYGSESSALAATRELNRIIAMSAQQSDRTFRITVEELALSPPQADREERARPPKPPMDGAVLHVRGGGQFVLVRQTAEGRPFVTGCNGRTSWAVKPDGPVRVSDDVTRFHRDVPGHEHQMPLVSVEEGLERLREAYETRLLPVETDEVGRDEEPSRLLVAVKKRGFRGPKRVEITYGVRTGHIRQMRFIEMPYGPERLTLRLTLVEQQDLGAAFFDHESHHEAERKVEAE